VPMDKADEYSREAAECIHPATRQSLWNTKHDKRPGPQAAVPLLSLRPEDLPEEMQGDYAALRLLLTHEPLSSEAGATPPHFNDEHSSDISRKDSQHVHRVNGWAVGTEETPCPLAPRES
jgi:hypothetical protein